MNIPGANLLAMASRVIRFDTLQLSAFVSRTSDAAGEWVSTFAAPVEIQGSLQPLGKDLYQQLGLNLAKNYMTLYTSAVVNSTDRDREGDKLTFKGTTWQAESDLSWAGIDGFTKILCVEIP